MPSGRSSFSPGHCKSQGRPDWLPPSTALQKEERVRIAVVISGSARLVTVGCVLCMWFAVEMGADYYP